MKGNKLVYAAISIIAVALVAGGYLLFSTGGEPEDEEFGSSNLVFCSEEPVGYMNYTPQPDNTYSQGDKLWTYFNLNNQEYNLHSDGSFEIWVESDLTLKTAGGESRSFSFTLRENLPAHRNPENVYLAHYLTIPENLPPGQYTLEVNVSDKLGGENASISGSFTLVEGEKKISLDPWDGLLRSEDIPSGFVEDTQNEWEMQDNTWFGVPFEKAAARYWMHSTEDKSIGVMGFVCPTESDGQTMFSRLSEYWRNYMENQGYGASTTSWPTYGEETESIQLTKGGENISFYVVTFRTNNVAVAIMAVGHSRSETENYCALVERRIANQ
ncbi:hypothetical protein AKJ64_02715 [candidate division MSBL1 archaeon SCGC-AAA259E17]|uniref:Uncharacterized protein n=1 Tax=candidate division MSBL1 archaeon SCGC-AAA259E17 TaxID=1698263 RepID=A0A133UEV0_9EURY|nr:hypothetical protein AKJ64_02715 [candidate division MSBL1 archaeon SCGC-AAA259E17]